MPFRGTITDSAPPQLRRVLRKPLKTTQLSGADEIAPLNVGPRIEQERGVGHVFSNTKTMLDR